MSRAVFTGARAVALAAALTLVPAAAAAAPAFVLEPLGDGVALATPVEPGPGRTNSLVVTWPDGVLVAGAQPTPAAARELLAVVAGDDPARVRFLVLSHGHAEAAGGAAAFPASTTVISSEAARRYVMDDANDVAAELEVLGLEDAAAIPRRAPTIGITGSVTFAAAAPTVVLSPIGDGHAPGGLVVEVPELGLVWIGGLLAGERRATFAGDGRMEPLMSGLNRLLRDGYDTYCGLRLGPVDAASVRRQRDALAWLRSAVDGFILDGVKVGDLQAAVAGSPDLAEHFEPRQPYLEGLVQLVIDEAVLARAKRGLILE